jgi:DNA primase
MWDSIVLVENTFVSMWLRDLNATATFGSHLSDTHIDKLVHSKIKHVTFLWDGGTEYATEIAAKKLKKLGIPSNVIALPGKKQPDDYSKDDIKEMIDGR